MSKKHLLSYSLERATIDLDSIESEETRRSLAEIKELRLQNRFKEASEKVPDLTFEFNAENMDSDYSEWLVNPHISFDIDRNNENHSVSIVFEDEKFKLVADILFEIELKTGVKPEKFQEWIEDNGGWAACTVLGDWSYLDDEGGDLFILGIKRKRR